MPKNLSVEFNPVSPVAGLPRETNGLSCENAALPVKSALIQSYMFPPQLFPSVLVSLIPLCRAHNKNIQIRDILL